MSNVVGYPWQINVLYVYTCARLLFFTEIYRWCFPFLVAGWLDVYTFVVVGRLIRHVSTRHQMIHWVTHNALLGIFESYMIDHTKHVVLWGWNHPSDPQWVILKLVEWAIQWSWVDETTWNGLWDLGSTISVGTFDFMHPLSILLLSGGLFYP